jgi:hypothetical protein
MGVICAVAAVAAYVFGPPRVGAQIAPLIVVPPPPPGITFSSLTGPSGAAYAGHTENEFAVTPTAGFWFQSIGYGNAAHSIYDGSSPTNALVTGVIQVTDSLGLFTLSKFEYSSNNGNSSYDIQGYLGDTLQYHETGTLMGSFEPFSFRTNTVAHATDPIDGLFIAVIPGFGVSSINLDNISVASVPEPGSWLLLTVGLALLVRRARA